MLANLLTEQRNPASARIDERPTLEMLQVINEQDRLVAEAVAAALPAIARAVDLTVERMRRGGRLFYIGAGTSGRLGVLDASECPPTFNVPYGTVVGIMAGGDAALTRATEVSEDSPEQGARDLAAHEFRAEDVLVGIAASGRTPYVLGGVAEAKRRGGGTVGLSCTSGSALSHAAEIPIEVLTGPEVVTGSTRMKAGTATKLVLNMISTAAMIQLGYVYDNLMVNVQPKNEKLVDRARRIVRELTGVEEAEAARLFEAAGRSVRTAVVMSRRGADRAEAEALLATAQGRLRPALAVQGERAHGKIAD